MEAKSAKKGEVSEMFYRRYPLFPHWLRGLAKASQFQWTSLQLRSGEGTFLEMRVACSDDLQKEENKLQKL